MERGLTAGQVGAALWRRKGLAGAVGLLVLALGAVLVLSQPAVYEATAVVRVQPQRPGEEMVQRTVSEPAEQRLLSLRQDLLARPLLLQAVRELELYPELVASRGAEAAVGRLRRDLTLRVEGESAFELTYAHSDPQVAARVANRLPALYAESVLRQRQEQAARAQQLFEDELSTLGRSVSGWEERIARFKVERLGELPEQLEMNMRAMDRTGALLRSRLEELRVAEARRSELARARYGADSEPGRLQAAEVARAQELLAARSQWTEDHPEVRRLQRELEYVRLERREAERRHQIEREELARTSRLIQSLQEEKEALEREIKLYQQRMERTPQWAHELGVLQRDYEISRAKYQSVLSRKVEAELARELEARAAEDLFHLVSPAGVPVSPARPDRVSGLLIALVLAAGLAVLVALVADARDDTLRSEEEVRERLPLPLLAVVPQVQGKAGGDVPGA